MSGMGNAGAICAALIEDVGFEAVGGCATSELRVHPEVRDMCASGRCRMYGRNWACPPACGTLEEFRALIAGRARCCVVQTVRGLDDEFDGEGMLAAERTHKRRMLALHSRLRDAGLDVLVLAAGACTLCESCAYPKACLHPGDRLVSLEAAGLMVSDVCERAGVPYSHGALTVAFTGAVLV